MEWYYNLPYLSIFLAMGVGIAMSVTKNGRLAYRVTVLSAALISVMSLVFLLMIDRAGVSLSFTMGKFPAPFGNEIRFGPLQGLFASCFSLVMTLAMLGGRTDFFHDVTEKKQGLACVFLLMTLASLLVLTYTNDAFTGYVFIEISTISACALVSVKDRGPTLMATIRYLFMSLLGSGLFLFGLGFLDSLGDLALAFFNLLEFRAEFFTLLLVFVEFLSQKQDLQCHIFFVLSVIFFRHASARRRRMSSRSLRLAETPVAS